MMGEGAGHGGFFLGQRYIGKVNMSSGNLQEGVFLGGNQELGKNQPKPGKAITQGRWGGGKTD
jgi:hypothetical protein